MLCLNLLLKKHDFLRVPAHWENQLGSVRALKIQVKSTYLDPQIHLKFISIEPY